MKYYNSLLLLQGWEKLLVGRGRRKAEDKQKGGIGKGLLYLRNKNSKLTSCCLIFQGHYMLCKVLGYLVKITKEIILRGIPSPVALSVAKDRMLPLYCAAVDLKNTNTRKEA